VQLTIGIELGERTVATFEFDLLTAGIKGLDLKILRNGRGLDRGRYLWHWQNDEGGGSERPGGDAY
jgi:hypothetical protein